MTSKLLKLRPFLGNEEEVETLNSAAETANDFLSTFNERCEHISAAPLTQSEGRVKEAALALLDNYFGLMSRFMQALDEESQ